MQSAAVRWWANPACQLHWRQWQEQDFILFNAASGQTHFLTALAADVLHRLQQTRLTTSELLVQLSEVYEFESIADFKAHLEQMLDAMDDFGLIMSGEG